MRRQNKADEKPKVIKLPSGVKVCAIHRVPLMTIKGFEDPTLLEAIPLFESDRKREEQNPNAIPTIGF